MKVTLAIVAVLTLGCRQEPTAAPPTPAAPPPAPTRVEAPPPAKDAEPPPPASPSVDACGKDAVLAVVHKASPELRACYETQLQMQQALSSKVIVRWVVGADGRVQDAEVVAATPGQPDFGRCVLDTVRRMTFEKPAGGRCEVTWPFVFSAS